MPGIILCGAEGEAFLYENALNSHGRDDKRRGSVRLAVGQTMYRRLPQGYADMWLHVRFAGVSGNQHNRDVVSIFSGSTKLASIYANGVTPGIYTLRHDVMGSTGPNIEGTSLEFYNYDIHIVVDSGTTTVDFYRNEVLRHSASFSNSLLPNTIQLSFGSTTPDASPTYFQDFIVTDALPTVGMELATLTPSAVGNYDDFHNDYASISAPGYSAASTIYTSTPGARESWFLSDPAFNIGDKVIYGVAMTTVAQTDLAELIEDFEPFLRMGATNYANPLLGVDNIAPNAYTTVWRENPTTSNPWTLPEIRGLEAGVRAI